MPLIQICNGSESLIYFDNISLSQNLCMVSLVILQITPTELCLWASVGLKIDLQVCHLQGNFFLLLMKETGKRKLIPGSREFIWPASSVSCITVDYSSPITSQCRLIIRLIQISTSNYPRLQEPGVCTEHNMPHGRCWIQIPNNFQVWLRKQFPTYSN